MKQRVRDMIRANNEVAEWNATHHSGDRVTVRRDSGAVLHTTTRSEAQLSSNGRAVIFLEGIAGYYLLDRVQGE
jgi:hypothetical protein